MSYADTADNHKPQIARWFNLLPSGVDFRRMPDGRTVVYPWPWPVQIGCVLPDAEAEVKLRAVMRRWLWAALPLFVAFGAYGSRALFSFALSYIAAYYARLLFALSGRERVPHDSGRCDMGIGSNSASAHPEVASGARSN
jgi:hypothetical protein